MTFPYGLSLASGVTVGHSVGANRPCEAKANCRMIAWINTGSSSLIIFAMLGLQKTLIPIYAANNDDVIRLAEGAYIVFLVAFLFDSSQCNLSGIIKAVGRQGLASLCSLGCMILIALPATYIATSYLNLGLVGLWIGYSLSTFCLTVIYAYDLTTLDWTKTAQDASASDEITQNSEHD